MSEIKQSAIGAQRRKQIARLVNIKYFKPVGKISIHRNLK